MLILFYLFSTQFKIAVVFISVSYMASRLNIDHRCGTLLIYCVVAYNLMFSLNFQSPLKLAMEIVKTDHTGVNKCYSAGMHTLVDLMLRKVICFFQ